MQKFIEKNDLEGWEGAVYTLDEKRIFCGQVRGKGGSGEGTERRIFRYWYFVRSNLFLRG